MAVVSGILAMGLESIMEIDETYHERLPDGRLRCVFVTTGFHPKLSEIKTKIWSLIGLPIQKVDEIYVEELQSGSLLKRYRITVILKPLKGGAPTPPTPGFVKRLFRGG
jgi:hypothetical protein